MRTIKVDIEYTEQDLAELAEAKKIDAERVARAEEDYKQILSDTGSVRLAELVTGHVEKTKKETRR